MGIALYSLFIFSFPHLFLLIVHANSSFHHSITPIPRDLYHSSDVLIKEIKGLVGRHSDRLTLETWRAGNKGYSAEVIVVTYRHGGNEIDDDSKYRILLSFGQHGRELVTSEVALRLLTILGEEYSMPNMDLVSLNRTLEKLVIKVVPMENLNGRKLVEAGELCERRNGRGVDLNRNWSVDWGKKEKDYDPYEENPGTAPFSEPETQIMRKLSKSFDPHIWVNVHSGMEALFMPYDHRNRTPDGLASQIIKSMLEDLNHLHCQNGCLVGSGGGSVGYLAHGTSTDYMYDIIKMHGALRHFMHAVHPLPSISDLLQFLSTKCLHTSKIFIRSTSFKILLPVRTFKGHTNEKNFVGLTVNNEYIACGSETNEVFVYHKAISKPAAWNKFSSSDMDDTDDDAASYFINAVCWKSDSLTMLTANSQGTIKVLLLAA